MEARPIPLFHKFSGEVTVKICIIHNFYRSGDLSGENIVVMKQIEALKSAGHEIQLISNDIGMSLKSIFKLLSIVFSWALNTGRDPIREIESGTEIVLVHNLYPGFSSRNFAKIDIPIVYWLHNYRLFCIANTFNFRGLQCELCLPKTKVIALLRRCHDAHLIKSLVSFIRLKLRVNAVEYYIPKFYVTLSQLSYHQLKKTSLPLDKIKVIPNFVDANNKMYLPQDKWIFIGRLSSEKGIFNLIKNLPSEIHLDIFGDGPLREDLELSLQDRPNINLMGTRSNSQLLELLPSYLGAFIPSLWTEGIPTTFLEYCAAGVPVIGLNNNSAALYISEYECGVVLDSLTEDNISTAAKMILSDRLMYSQNAKLLWADKFSESEWIKNMSKLFQILGLKENGDEKL